MILYTAFRNIHLPSVLIIVLALLSGCVATNSRVSDPAVGSVPVSALLLETQRADPRSRALSAFVQFRMSGADGDWEKALVDLKQATADDPDSVYLQLLLARVYLHMERPDPAIALLSRLLEKNSAVPDAHLLLGDIYVMQRRFADAVDHFNRALDLEPDSETLYLRLAMAFVQLEQSDEAFAILEELLQKRPEAEQAMLSLARIYRDNHQPQAAIRVFQRYLERRPEQWSVILELGELLEQQDMNAAIKLYQQALHKHPDAHVLRQQLAQLYLGSQKPQRALEQLLTVRAQVPRSLPGNQIGLLYLHMNRWREATDEFRQLIASGEDTGQNHYFLALALIGQSKNMAATEHLIKVQPADPTYREAMLQLAYLYLQEDQADAGKELLMRLLDEEFRDVEIYYYLVAFFQRQDDMIRAQYYADEAVNLYPQDARLLYQQGILFDAQDNHQAALANMERVLQIDDSHADALNFLAYYQAQTHTDLDLALERAKRAQELKPEGYIEDTLGWVYFKLGKYPQSRIHLERAIDLQPDDQVILEHLGDLYVAMELFEEAEQAYREALRVDPAAGEVLKKLNKLLREPGK